jgi:hypothetical protein
MKSSALFAYAIVLGAGALGGWAARQQIENTKCAYSAAGYERLTEDLRSFAKYSLVNVSQQVLGDIQQCWAAHPYAGPQHVIELADARVIKTGGYYVIFDPIGVTEVRLVFQVNDSGRVVKAYQYSTL